METLAVCELGRGQGSQLPIGGRKVVKDIYLLQVRAVFLLIITDQDKTGMGERQLPTGDPVRFPCESEAGSGDFSLFYHFQEESKLNSSFVTLFLRLRTFPSNFPVRGTGASVGLSFPYFIRLLVSWNAKGKLPYMLTHYSVERWFFIHTGEIQGSQVPISQSQISAGGCRPAYWQFSGTVPDFPRPKTTHTGQQSRSFLFLFLPGKRKVKDEGGSFMLVTGVCGKVLSNPRHPSEFLLAMQPSKYQGQNIVYC